MRKYLSWYNFELIHEYQLVMPKVFHAYCDFCVGKDCWKVVLTESRVALHLTDGTHKNDETWADCQTSVAAIGHQIFIFASLLCALFSWNPLGFFQTIWIWSAIDMNWIAKTLLALDCRRRTQLSAQIGSHVRRSSVDQSVHLLLR